jgi:hypothetical protein
MSQVGNYLAAPGVVVSTMELRTSEHPEPSHIHVPRPSRVAGRPAQLPGAELLDLCRMPGAEAERGSYRPDSD